MKKLLATLILIAVIVPSRADWLSFNAQRVSEMNAEEVTKHSATTNALGQVAPRVVISGTVPMSVTNTPNVAITSPLVTAADGSSAVETVRYPKFSGGTVAFSTNFWDAGTAELASPAVACSNAHVVAFGAKVVTLDFATSITFRVELSLDGGSTWYRNDDLQYVADTGLAETNRYMSVSADGATHARVLLSSPTNLALVSTDLVWRVKQ